jgi:hypothetical protein
MTGCPCEPIGAQTSVHYYKEPGDALWTFASQTEGDDMLRQEAMHTRRFITKIENIKEVSLGTLSGVLMILVASFRRLVDIHLWVLCLRTASFNNVIEMGPADAIHLSPGAVLLDHKSERLHKSVVRK